MNGKWGPVDTKEGAEFLKECEIIATTNAFNDFKRNVIFSKVIGNDHKTKIETDALYNSILSNKELVAKLPDFKRNDMLGTPQMTYYPLTGDISPGTLYFVAVLGNIISQIGDIKDFDIVEIGSGYGGQAEIILEYGCKSYTCIDVPETLNLCGRYLTTLGHNAVNFYTPGQIQDKKYDLVISNWCLSEMNLDGIIWYIEKVISKCKNGYFLMNIWDEDTKDLVAHLMSLHFQTIQVSSDKFTFDQAHKNNWLLVGSRGNENSNIG